MRRRLWLGFTCGLLATCGLYALNEAVYLPGLISARTKRPGLLITEFEHFEQTVDGKPICPRCGRVRHILRYQYGLSRDGGSIGTTPAGCGVGPDSPEYLCTRCDTAFGRTTFYVK